MRDFYHAKRKNFEYFHSFPSSDASDCNGQTEDYTDENKPLQNRFKHI